MSFPRYPAYKPSRVEQLGDVPEHWEVIPVKRCLKSITQGWSPQCESFPAEAGQWGVLKVGCVNGGAFDPSENKALPPSLEPQPDLAIRRGDVLVSRANTRELIGSVAVAEQDYERLMLCDKLYRLSVDVSRCDAAFLAHALSSPASRGVIESAASGTSSSMLNISQSAITGMFIAAPPLGEQQAVVSFVTRETAKIDALVEEQRRLIDLLKEKRQAVISQAVTKGLNPNVAMKDSGVAWLGKVPAHWSLKRIKHLVSRFEQGWSPQCDGRSVESDQEWGVLKVGCVNGGVFRSDENKALPSELEPLPELGLAADDLLISRANTRELVGSAAVVDRDYANLLLCDKLYRLRFDRGTCTSWFIGHYLATSGVRGQIELQATGASSSMVNIGQSTILELTIAFPDRTEQESITAYIQQACLQIDTLTTNAQSATALLQERRAALISAAVTGKIDVRGLAAEANAKGDVPCL